MNDKLLRKDITAVVVDDRCYPETTTYDENAISLENRVEVVDKEIVKIMLELDHARANKLFGIRAMKKLIATSLFLFTTALSALYLFISSNPLVFIIGIVTSLGCGVSLDLYLETGPYYSNKKTKKLEVKLKAAQEIREERQKELEDYLEDMPALEPVSEEYVIDFKEEYEADIKHVQSYLEQEAITRTRKRNKRGKK